MAVLLTEALVDDLAVYFLENMPAKVAELNAAYADGYVLPESVTYYVGERTINDGWNYPAVFLQATNMGVTRYDHLWTDADHTLAIGIACQSPSTEVIHRQRWRFIRAIWDLLVQRFFETTGDDYFMLHGDGDIAVEYEPVEGAAEASGQYVGRATFTVTFSKQEYV